MEATLLLCNGTGTIKTESKYSKKIVDSHPLSDHQDLVVGTIAMHRSNRYLECSVPTVSCLGERDKLLVF